MEKILIGILGIILLGIIEQLVAWIMEKVFSANSPLRKHLPAMFIAVLILAFIVVSLPVENLLPSATPTPPRGLLYQLTVQDAGTREPIEGAEVVLLVPGVPAFRASTDDAGIAAFMDLPDDVIGKSATLSIQTAGYEPYRLNVAIQLNQLPELIFLDRN